MTTVTAAEAHEAPGCGAKAKAHRDEEVAQIRLLAARGIAGHQIGKMYGVATSTVNRIAARSVRVLRAVDIGDGGLPPSASPNTAQAEGRGSPRVPRLIL
jgi:hypothetical protein